MLKFGHQYVEKGTEYYEAKYRQQQLRGTAEQAAALNVELVPLPELIGLGPVNPGVTFAGEFQWRGLI